MKKIGKMLFVCLLALMFVFFAFACGKGADNKDPEQNTGGNDGDSTLTIHDAYENNRPDYEGDFGYETRYEPIVPPPPDKEITLTLDESSPITFADGSNTFSININSSLTAEDFDLSGLDEGESLGGFAFMKEDGTYGTASSIDSISIPWEDATIKPYFKAEGYSYLSLEKRINTDGIPSSPIRYPSLVTGTLVNGDKYARKGIDIVTKGKTDIGSALRFDAPYDIPETENGTVYEYICNFENKGQYDLHLDGYIISMSSEYKNGSFAYESRYRMDIDLAPGESVTFNPQYSLMKNTNMLVYFVADRTMMDVNFGAAFYVKPRTDLSEPSVSTEPEEAAKSEITLKLPEGVTVSDSYVTELTAGETFVVPTAEQITNTTGRKIGGWYYENIFGMTFIGENTVAPDGTLTLSPYFAPESGTALTLGSGAANNLPDFYGKLADIIPEDLMNSPEYADADTAFTNDGTVIEGERGTLLTKTGTLAVDDIFRFKTSATIELNHKYRYTFDFENNGNEDVSFELYQLQGQLLYAPEDYAVSKEVTVKKGESATAIIEITMNGNNTNSLTLFRMIKATTSDLSLGVRMTIEDLGLDEANTRTLTIGGDYDIAFEGGSKTAEVLVGNPIPALVKGADITRDIAGMYTIDETGNKTEFDINGFVMPNNDVTVFPYFGCEEGYTSLSIGSGANNMYNTDGLNGSKTGDQVSSFYVDNTITINKNTLVEGGESGYEEKGIDVNVANAITAGSGLRFDTKYSVSSGNYTFRYNFENKGTSKISLKVYQINASSEYKNGNMAMTNTDRTPGIIELEAGESMEMEITFNQANSNNNVMTYFVSASDMPTGMTLAFSMSVKKA